MYDAARGGVHYIAADLDSRVWVEAGLARLEDYLATSRPGRRARIIRPARGGAHIAEADRTAQRNHNLDLAAWAALALRLLRP